MRETFREILRIMRAIALIIAGLRLEQRTDDPIGSLLGLTSVQVSAHMRAAKGRMAKELPAAASLLADREQKRLKGRAVAPLEWGWLCRAPSVGQRRR
jgi:hypothetical protein